jgi:hypothetical protein
MALTLRHYNYLLWSVILCTMLLLLTVVHHLSPCIVVIYCRALPSPCIVVVVYCGLLLQLVWFFVICFALRLLIIVHCFHLALLLFVVVCHLRLTLLLFFVMVHHPSPCDVGACCDALCIIIDHCVLSFLTLCGLLLLVLFCYFITPCFFQVLMSPSLVLLLFVVVRHSLPYVITYLLR